MHLPTVLVLLISLALASTTIPAYKCITYDVPTDFALLPYLTKNFDSSVPAVQLGSRRSTAKAPVSSSFQLLSTFNQSALLHSKTPLVLVADTPITPDLESFFLTSHIKAPVYIVPSTDYTHDLATSSSSPLYFSIKSPEGMKVKSSNSAVNLIVQTQGLKLELAEPEQHEEFKEEDQQEGGKVKQTNTILLASQLTSLSAFPSLPTDSLSFSNSVLLQSLRHVSSYISTYGSHFNVQGLFTSGGVEMNYKGLGYHLKREEFNKRNEVEYELGVVIGDLNPESDELYLRGSLENSQTSKFIESLKESLSKVLPGVRLITSFDSINFDWCGLNYFNNLSIPAIHLSTTQDFSFYLKKNFNTSTINSSEKAVDYIKLLTDTVISYATNTPSDVDSKEFDLDSFKYFEQIFSSTPRSLPYFNEMKFKKSQYFIEVIEDFLTQNVSSLVSRTVISHSNFWSSPTFYVSKGTNMVVYEPASLVDQVIAVCFTTFYVVLAYYLIVIRKPIEKKLKKR
ncbi:hypothetical protein RCL1_002923 [Eukaryota sp. TZLM3-RCL]